MTLPGLDAPENHFSTSTLALVIGAGLAGCALARALVKAGFRCVLYDRHNAVASETSAVPCALIRPHVTKAEQTSTRYFGEAFDRIHTELKNEVLASEGVVVKNSQANITASLSGVLQLVSDSSQWPENSYYSRLTKAEASQLTGTELAGDALYFRQAGILNMHSLCNYWIGQCNDVNQQSAEFIGQTAVHSLRRTADGWQLIGSDNQVINESPLVIIANAQVAGQLAETTHLPLQKSRGQISHFTSAPNKTVVTPGHIITGKCSVIPTSDGFWAGSTHQRYNDSRQLSTRDDQLNLQSAIELCPLLDQALVNSPDNTLATEKNASHSWAGFRYSTPDRMPVVGAAPKVSWYRQNYAGLHHGRRRQKFPQPHFHEGLYLLTGLGSRGALHSVYAAEILSSIISGTIQSSDDSDQTISRLLHPGRFIIRQLRRGS